MLRLLEIENEHSERKVKIVVSNGDGDVDSADQDSCDERQESGMTIKVIDLETRALIVEMPTNRAGYLQIVQDEGQDYGQES